MLLRIWDLLQTVTVIAKNNNSISISFKKCQGIHMCIQEVSGYPYKVPKTNSRNKSMHFAYRMTITIATMKNVIPNYRDVLLYLDVSKARSS